MLDPSGSPKAGASPQGFPRGREAATGAVGQARDQGRDRGAGPLGGRPARRADLARTSRRAASRSGRVGLDRGGGGLYLAGLCRVRVFFGRVMQDSSDTDRAGPGAPGLPDQPPGQVRAGQGDGGRHAGGPGRPLRGRPATAAFATLYETLVMMAAGGLVAARRVRDRRPALGRCRSPVRRSRCRVPLALLGLGLGLAFLVVV